MGICETGNGRDERVIGGSSRTYPQIRSTKGSLWSNKETNVGGRELLAQLNQDERLLANASASQGLQEMSLLFNYLDALDSAKTVGPTISFLIPGLIRSLLSERIGLLHWFNL